MVSNEWSEVVPHSLRSPQSSPKVCEICIEFKWTDRSNHDVYLVQIETLPGVA